MAFENNKQNGFQPNLFQINTGVDNYTLKNVEYEIRQYISYLNRCKDFLKKETQTIDLEKKIIETEVRYCPVNPKNKKEEKAIKTLFNENTKFVFIQNQNFNKNNEIEIIEQNEDENYIVLRDEIQENKIYLTPDIKQIEKQIKALDNFKNQPLKEHNSLLQLFGNPDDRFWNQNFEYSEYNWKILTNDKIEGYDQQRNLVSKAMQTKDFALLEGPPGSGKTTTIIELIIQNIIQGKRVLLCSATHAAIDNVFERINEKYNSICKDYIIPVRISRFEKPVKENVRPFLLKNLVKTYKDEIEKHLNSNNELKSQKYILENLFLKSEHNLELTKSEIEKKIKLEKQLKQNLRKIKNRISLINFLIDLVSKNQNLSDTEFFFANELLSELKNEIDPFERIILDSSNLVGGTMIGIMQHPDIILNKKGASFDVLIIDEASKVTFADFIVPALHAKKWILVGDIKQLSPYVENDYISESLEQLLDTNIQKAIVNQFELKSKINDNRFSDCIKIYFTQNNLNEEYELIKEFTKSIVLIDDNWTVSPENIAHINSSEVIMAKDERKIKEIIAENIFVKSIYISGEPAGLKQNYRQNYLRKNRKSKSDNQNYFFNSKDADWSELVASKLNQSFSFRNASEDFENIDKDLDFLIPDISIPIKNKQGEIIRETTLKSEIENIKRLVFPSILELLQNGIGRTQNQYSNRVISDGFSESAKKSRFVSLTFQYRMHPDIAKTSKENFYKENKNLEPSNIVTGNRNWNYAKDEPVVRWVHNTSNEGNKIGERITNKQEINDIENELVEFLKWAKDNPQKNNENYEVAILTFYLNQESELRKMVRKITGQYSAFSKFSKNNTNIFLYTVDKFQGQEADMVLLGFTKFTSDAHFNSPNRLNVALTRARHKLILFGNRAWFSQKSKLKALKDLATNFKSNKKY